MTEKDLEAVESPTNKINKRNILLIFVATVIILFLSVTLFVALQGSSTQCSSPSEAKEIIYFTRKAHTELFYVYSDGSDMKTLLDSSFSQRIFDPIWTKDSVVFGTDDHIYTIKASAKAPVKLVKDTKSLSYEFSPDNKILVYEDANNKKLVAMKLENNQPLWSKDLSDYVMNIQYAPDGKSIYFLTHNFEGEAKSTLYKVNAVDGANQTEIAEFGPYARNVKLSPDGKKIIYTREGESRAKIYLFDLETKETPTAIYEFDNMFMIPSAIYPEVLKNSFTNSNSKLKN